MSEHAESFSKAVEKYNPFQDNYIASRELLELIQHVNQRDLEESGFVVRFLDSLGTLSHLDPQAKILVSQTVDPDGCRKIWGVLRQQRDDGRLASHTHHIGTVDDNGERHVNAIFHAEDLDIAIKQLDGLQTMKDLGMLTIDRSLSHPDWVNPNSFL